MELTALPLRRTRPYIPSGGHMTNYLSEVRKVIRLEARPVARIFSAGGTAIFFMVICHSFFGM